MLAHQPLRGHEQDSAAVYYRDKATCEKQKSQKSTMQSFRPRKSTSLSVLLSKELCKEFHLNSVKWGSWCGLTTEHCRCCHRLGAALAACRVSIWPLTSHTSSALHRRQLHPQQLFTTLQHSLFQSTSVQSLVTKEQAGPFSARPFHEHYPCTAQRALPSQRMLTLPQELAPTIVPLGIVIRKCQAEKVE